ncbi:MAG: hypothetical protein COB40_10350 [Marinosulfonomonas sp.]|nr:MAG: hypothetical protein COB40_10350 [Marinosulfonomonas sp.]
MTPGRLAVLFWAYDNRGKRNLYNHIVFSDDEGRSIGPAVLRSINANQTYFETAFESGEGWFQFRR